MSKQALSGRTRFLFGAEISPTSTRELLDRGRIWSTPRRRTSPHRHRGPERLSRRVARPSTSSRQRCRRILGLGLIVALGVPAGRGHAQALPPGAFEQLQGALGDRIEALVILGGDNGLTGGAYVFRGGADVDLSITKVGGAGTLGQRRPLGWKRLAWAPILEGNVGYVQSTNRFTSTVLSGNVSEYETFGAALGGGVRLYLIENASIGPRVSLIYGRTANTFAAGTAAGALVQQAFGGGLVNWTLNSFTLAPAVDFQLDWTLRTVAFRFVSDYRPFLTWSFRESTPLIVLDGTSHVWTNNIDVDIPLGVSVLRRELHVGGFFNRASLFGDVSRALRTDAINTANARLVADVLDVIPRMKWIGIGGSYFWGSSFDGYSIGVDVRMDF